VNVEKRNNFDWKSSHRANHRNILTATEQTLRCLEGGIGEIDRPGDWKLIFFAAIEAWSEN
jgi:hypothetical protein